MSEHPASEQRGATKRLGLVLVGVALLGWVGWFVLGGGQASERLRSSSMSGHADTAVVGESRPGSADDPPITDPRPTVAAPTATEPQPQRRPTPPLDDTPGRFTAAFTGDVLPHAPMLAAKRSGSGFDFSGVFDEIRPIVGGANLAVCHMEAPILAEGQAVPTQPRLGTPMDLLRAVADAGFDRCSTASNHAFDEGEAGVRRSIAAFAEAGMGQSGMNDSSEVTTDVLTINGVRVAHLSYTYGFDNQTPPAARSWLVNKIDTTEIIRAARSARRRGAEVVIASLHWGEPQAVEPTAAQERVARVLTASGQINLIVGHHGHVLQPIRKVNGVWVVYGLGNVLSNHPANPGWKANTQDAAVVTVRFRRAGAVISVEQPTVWPTWCDKQHGYVIRLVQPDERADDLPNGVAAALDASLRRTTTVLGSFLAD